MIFRGVEEVLLFNFHIKIQNNPAISEQRDEMITIMIFGRIKTCRHMWHMGIIEFWGSIIIITIL